MMLTTVRRKATRRAAFTLLEVLVVVAILVILAGVATVATTRYLEDAKKSRAQLGCQGIAQAIEAYMLSPGNPTGEGPGQLSQLYQPQWGGTSFLRNGEQDTIDPWNQHYSIEPATKSDGSPYYLVRTTASDKTPISQFGIGDKAQPRF